MWKISTTWGVLSKGEILELARKARKDAMRAKSERRKRFLQRLSSELRKAVFMDKYVAQMILNDAQDIFCMAYCCEDCPINQKCQSLE